MDEVGRTRLRFFLILLAGIVLIHAVVLYMIVPSGRRSRPEASTPGTIESGSAENPGQAPANPEDSPSRTQSAAPASAGDFYARLTAFPRTTTAPDRPQPRFRKYSTNVRFGTPLNFASARHGDLPVKEVPGSTGAATGIVVDMDTRRVLWEKNSDRPVRIASMGKMMTLLLAMETLEKRPDLSLKSPVKITNTALKVPRTGIIWLDPRETMPLGDLMMATAIRSANDAATMIAEFLGGSVDNYVSAMNRRAGELGLTSVKFVNPCGLPDRKKGESVGSAADMVRLGEHLLEYPQIMEWMGTKKASIRNGRTDLYTTNKLISPHWPGVDGMKTGYYSAAGSCLTFSALRDGRRIMGCVTGFKSSRDRDRFCRKLIDWAYKQK